MSNYKYLLAIAVLLLSLMGLPEHSNGQNRSVEPQTATLLARRVVNGIDNYTQAVYSFKYGSNGPALRRITRNNWDILFGNSPVPDAFDVTMVVDDCSRIKDLGPLDWPQVKVIPALPAYDKPTREPSVQAVTGHMYLVHTKDSILNQYALFRVENLDPGKSVTISWKLINSPE